MCVYSNASISQRAKIFIFILSRSFAVWRVQSQYTLSIHSIQDAEYLRVIYIGNYDACHPLTYLYLKDVPHTSPGSSVEYQLQTQYRNVYMCETLSRIENILRIYKGVHCVEPNTTLFTASTHGIEVSAFFSGNAK